MSLRGNTMPQEYRTVPSSDGEVAKESFELEDSHHTRRIQRTSHRKLTFVVTCLIALLVLIIGYSVYVGDDKKEPPPAAATGEPAKSNGIGEHDEIEKSMDEQKVQSPTDDGTGSTGTASPPKMIFCYGDSLTYGMTPGTREPYPYSKYLEQELNTLFDPSATNPNATSVQHMGLPGWTATQMLNHIHDDKTPGVCNIIDRIPTLSLLIILVGTNDIGQMTNAGKDIARSIIQSIVDLHNGALNCAKGEGNDRLRTISVGIPGSAYLERVRVASEMTSFINSAMKGFAAASGGKTSYLEFPFPYQDDDPKWGEDGIHMSPEGYETFGKALAPHVKMILESIDSV